MYHSFDVSLFCKIDSIFRHVAVLLTVAADRSLGPSALGPSAWAFVAGPYHRSPRPVIGFPHSPFIAYFVFIQTSTQAGGVFLSFFRIYFYQMSVNLYDVY